MKSAIFFAAAASAAVLPRQQAGTPAGKAFTLLAVRSASPIHFMPVQANDGQFWIGKDTTASCPSADGCGIYTTNTTVVDCAVANGNSTTCAMNAVVYGGQTVFVQSNGTLGYGEANNNVVPHGAATQGFTLTLPYGDQTGFFNYPGHNSKGAWAACPTGAGCDLGTGKDCAPWAVVSTAVSAVAPNCLGFDIVTYPSDVMAWEYD